MGLMPHVSLSILESRITTIFLTTHDEFLDNFNGFLPPRERRKLHKYVSNICLVSKAHVKNYLDNTRESEVPG